MSNMPDIAALFGMRVIQDLHQDIGKLYTFDASGLYLGLVAAHHEPRPHDTLIVGTRHAFSSKRKRKRLRSLKNLRRAPRLTRAARRRQLAEDRLLATVNAMLQQVREQTETRRLAGIVGPHGAVNP